MRFFLISLLLLVSFLSDAQLIQKDSMDCILESPLLDKYLNSLQNVMNTYMEKFPMSKSEAAWGIVENVNIQHYKPNQGFKSWHTERSCANNNRHLVFMTYLNDVMDGGKQTTGGGDVVF